jgi:ABC-type cobalamin transport system permease subunit
VKTDQRRRDPRSISGDKWLQPFNQQAASGQLMMWQARRAPGLEEIVNMKFRPVSGGNMLSTGPQLMQKLLQSHFALLPL